MAFSWVHFDGANTEQYYQEFIGKGRDIAFKGKAAERIFKNISRIISCYQNDLEVQEPEHSKLIYECLCLMVFAEEVTDKKDSGIIEQAKEYIRQHLGEELTLEVVANQVGLSASHFSRVFKKETSYSPYEYIILVRINKAKHLLKTTEMAIKEIAYEIGYRSESNFCNAFTQRMGISPTYFRRYPT